MFYSHFRMLAYTRAILLYTRGKRYFGGLSPITISSYNPFYLFAFIGYLPNCIMVAIVLGLGWAIFVP